MQFTVLDDSSVVQIMTQYGIEAISSFKILSGGSENTNYLIDCTKRQFVLTICEQKTSESAEELVHLLEYLAEHDFETSKAIRTSTNEPISYWNQKPVMLKVFLEGEIIEDLPYSILKLIGSEMGRLHQIDAPTYLPNALNYGKEYFHETSDYAPNSSFDKWLKEIKEYMQPYFSKALPKSLIHSDIFFSNIVISADHKRASIMDFEEAANYYRVFDIGMTIVGLCSEGDTVNIKKAQHLLEGYQEEVQLLDIEKQALQAFTVYAAAAMTFWRHRNFNYVNPNIEMNDHYLELKIIADFVKHLPQADFLEILT